VGRGENNERVEGKTDQEGKQRALVDQGEAQEK
jgi:hypothetical protein